MATGRQRQRKQRGNKAESRREIIRRENETMWAEGAPGATGGEEPVTTQ